MALLPDELGPRPPQVVVGRDPVLMERRPPHRGTPASAAALSRFEGAGVSVLEHRCGPGEHVYLRGDADRGLCFLLEGTLRVYKAYGGGSAEATMGLLAGGGLFGEPSLRAGGRHRDSAEALSACRVAMVPKGPLGAHLLREPGDAVQVPGRGRRRQQEDATMIRGSNKGRKVGGPRQPD